MYDSFYADLECANCGKRHHTELQTKLRTKPDGSYFTIGDRFEFDRAEARESGYYVLKPPLGDLVHIGQQRDDSPCGPSYSWVEVVIDGNLITAIRGVVLNAETFARLDLIDDEVGHWIAAKLNVPAHPGFERLPDLGRAWLAEDPAREL